MASRDQKRNDNKPIPYDELSPLNRERFILKCLIKPDIVDSVLSGKHVQVEHLLSENEIPMKIVEKNVVTIELVKNYFAEEAWIKFMQQYRSFELRTTLFVMPVKKHFLAHL